MKKIFSFLCLFMAIVAMSSCSSAKEEKGTSGTGNAALDNIFERKSVATLGIPLSSPALKSSSFKSLLRLSRSLSLLT